MQTSTPPTAIAVEVVATQPTDADRAAIAHLRARGDASLPPVTYLVKVCFETMPQATSQGWALYVDDFRIPKYWEYQHGIFFKVFDPQFFRDHQGQPLRFSQNGIDFIDTGLRLPLHSDAHRSAKDSTKLPLQNDVLSMPPQPHKPVRKQKSRPKTKKRAPKTARNTR